MSKYEKRFSGALPVLGRRGIQSKRRVEKTSALERMELAAPEEGRAALNRFSHLDIEACPG